MPAYMNTPYLKNPQYHEMNPAAMGNQVMGGHPMQMAHPNMMPQQQQYMSFPQSTNGYIPPAALPDVSSYYLLFIYTMHLNSSPHLMLIGAHLRYRLGARGSDAFP